MRSPLMRSKLARSMAIKILKQSSCHLRYFLHDYLENYRFDSFGEADRDQYVQ